MTATAAEPGRTAVEQPPMVLMTLRAYRVLPDGTRVEQAPRREVTSAQNLAPMASAWAWPPCECPRHMPGRHR